MFHDKQEETSNIMELTYKLIILSHFLLKPPELIILCYPHILSYNYNIYIIFSQGSTDVKWNTQNPQWNEQINIGFQFPSICEKVKVHLKDK